MKKILGISLVVAFMAISSPVFAHETTEDHHHSNGDPRRITQAWGLTGHETPVVAEGAVIVDESGSFIDQCNFAHGCYNLTSTDYYRNSMIETARQLVENGRIQFFPSYTYWAQFVK